MNKKWILSIVYLLFEKKIKIYFLIILLKDIFFLYYLTQIFILIKSFKF